MRKGPRPKECQGPRRARRGRGTNSPLKPPEGTSPAHTKNQKSVCGFKPLLWGNLLGSPRKHVALAWLQRFLSGPPSTPPRVRPFLNAPHTARGPVSCESLRSPSPLASFTFPSPHFLHWSFHSQNINLQIYFSSLFSLLFLP